MNRLETRGKATFPKSCADCLMVNWVPLPVAIYVDYRNWANSTELFPELLYRFKSNLNSAESRGIEVYARYDRGGKITWWASYALASVRDNTRNLVYQGIEYTEGSGYYPGRYNQRHTIYFDLNYRPNPNWHFDLAWQYHTGWPYTDQVIKTSTLPDGSTQYDWMYGEFRGWDNISAMV